MTPRDGLIGAGIMLALNFSLAGLGVSLHRLAGEMLKGLAFPAWFTFSMPSWLMKGSPGKHSASSSGEHSSFSSG